MDIRYILPLKVLWLANLVLCQYYRGIYINLNRKVRVVMQLVDLYKPYVFFTSSFDDSNTEKLRVAIRESDVDENLFNFDPRCIDWEDYIMNTHIPGLKNFDDSNTEKLRVAIRESDVDENLFNFDPRCIDWEDYIMNTHIPGLKKYSMKP
nr:alcohol-forming fatty acyl-coa reductase [Quercus suber]